MKKVSLNKFIDTIMFFYILSLYLFSNKAGMTIYSNALAFFLVVVICMNFLITRRKLIFNMLLKIQLIFIILSTLSYYFAIDADTVIRKVKTLLLIFLLMLSLINYIDSYKKVRNIIISFIYSGFIVSIYILISSDFLSLTRLGSELGNVNAVGMIISISSIFCFYIILSEKKYYWYGLILITMITTILLTGSRKALLFLFLAILMILYLKSKKSIKRIIWLFLISILALSLIYYIVIKVPLFYEIIGKRIENLFYFISGQGTNEVSINERTYMIKFGIEMFKSKFFTGYGIDNYRFLLGANYGLETYAHNNYIELMVGIGIFGVFIYYLTHIIVLRDLFYKCKQSSNKLLYNTFIAIISVYIVLSISIVYYDSKYFSILIALGSVIGSSIYMDKLL